MLYLIENCWSRLWKQKLLLSLILLDYKISVVSNPESHGNYYKTILMQLILIISGPNSLLLP